MTRFTYIDTAAPNYRHGAFTPDYPQFSGTTSAVHRFNQVGALVTDSNQLITKLDYTTSGTVVPIFTGEAKAGSGTADSVWRIKKFLYTGTTTLTDTQWASGNPNFDKQWSARTTYTYS